MRLPLPPPINACVYIFRSRFRSFPFSPVILSFALAFPSPSSPPTPHSHPFIFLSLCLSLPSPPPHILSILLTPCFYPSSSFSVCLFLFLCHPRSPFPHSIPQFIIFLPYSSPPLLLVAHSVRPFHHSFLAALLLVTHLASFISLQSFPHNTVHPGPFLKPSLP